MMSYSTQNYSSLKKSTWPHILMVGQTLSNLVKLSQTWSNLLKTCIIWYGSLQPTPPRKEKFRPRNFHLCHRRDEGTASTF